VTPDEVLIYLRRQGVTVHLVTQETPGSLRIFLEANLGQAEFAEYLVRQLPTFKESSRVAPGILSFSQKLLESGP
jgi:hypothetical protein